MRVAEMLPLLEGLRSKKICVVGDFMIDHNRIVTGKRLSPEAPIPILEPEAEEFRLGGAGNVANNLRDLGVGKVCLITAVGSKNYSPSVFDARDRTLLESSFIVFETGRLTTVKERIVTRRQQIVRIDIQSIRPIKPKTIKLLIGKTEESLKGADAVIFSDYAHGVCVPQFIKYVMSMCVQKGIPTVVDSKAKDTLEKYSGATVAIPNIDEARLILKTDEANEQKVATDLLAAMKLKAAAVTLGPRGVLLATAEGTKHYDALNNDTQHEVVDVTGAGDTVAAIVAIGLVLKFGYDDIFRLANVAAGVKVQKRGVATATPKEIAAAGLLYDDR